MCGTLEELVMHRKEHRGRAMTKSIGVPPFLLTRPCGCLRCTATTLTSRPGLPDAPLLGVQELPCLDS